MSRDLLEVNGTYEQHLAPNGVREQHDIPCVMSVNSFYGGDRRGPCVQLTVQGDHSYIQITRAEALRLAACLCIWAAEVK